MIDFWNGMNTPNGVVWFNRFTNEYEFEKRPDGFDAYLLGKRACEDMKHLMMPKFDVGDIVTVPYDHGKTYWTVMAGFCAALAKKVYGSTGTVKQIIKASNYEDSQALPFQGESVKDIATRAMAMLLTDVMKGD